MSSKLYKVSPLIVLLLDFAAATVALFMGGCDTLTDSGDPMRCKWTFNVVFAVLMVPILVNAFTFRSKNFNVVRLFPSAVIICTLACSIIMTSAGIGICSDSAMHCHTTRLVVQILLALAFFASLAELVIIKKESKKGEIEVPKKTL